MTALSESSYLMSIHNIFSWPISTLFLFSQIGKPVLDKWKKLEEEKEKLVMAMKLVAKK